MSLAPKSQVSVRVAYSVASIHALFAFRPLRRRRRLRLSLRFSLHHHALLNRILPYVYFFTRQKVDAVERLQVVAGLPSIFKPLGRHPPVYREVHRVSKLVLSLGSVSTSGTEVLDMPVRIIALESLLDTAIYSAQDGKVRIESVRELID